MFTQGATARGAAGYTALDAGGSFRLSAGVSVIFTLGHSIAGASHAVAFFGVVTEW